MHLRIPLIVGREDQLGTHGFQVRCAGLTSQAQHPRAIARRAAQGAATWRSAKAGTVLHSALGSSALRASHEHRQSAIWGAESAGVVEVVELKSVGEAHLAAAHTGIGIAKVFIADLAPGPILLDLEATPAATAILVQDLISAIHNAQLSSVCTHGGCGAARE